jgi:adenylate cyclase
MRLNKDMKKLLSPWLALVTLSLLLIIRFADFSFIESVRLRYFDTLITSKTVTQSEQISVVNIDDKSIEKYGQFPFPRSDYASIIDDLYSRGAGLVVFNLYLPDNDRFGQDDRLANTLRKHAVVFPQVGSTDKQKGTPFRPGVSEIGEPASNFAVNYPSIQANIKQINDNATGIGVVNVLPEIDGVVRRVPMVVSSNGILYPSITLETLRVASGDPSFQVKSSESGIEAVRIPSFRTVDTDEYGRVWIDWSSKPIEHSLIDLPKDFGGRIVIVGLTARGLNNPVASANGEIFPHYLQSSILDTLVNGTNISRPYWATGVEILSLIVLSLLVILLARWKYGFIPILFIIGSLHFVSTLLFKHTSFLIDSLYPIISLVIIYTHVFTVKFITELNQKLQIKKQFGTYLSPALVEKLQKNPELLRLGGESRELSIMFTDVRGFTTISEHYGKDVQGLTKIMNRYMTAMTAKIIENNGTLDKYIGDAQMAFWNAPLDEPNHAKLAVKTALEMMESLDAFNKEIQEEGIPAFGMGLGINTGSVVVGNMGSSQRFDYTCLGDPVNLASRLEGQSKPYGVKMILGSLTAEQVKDEYPVVELDTIAVKGKTEGVKIFTPCVCQDEHYKLHKKYLKAYYDGNWEDGGAVFLAERLSIEGPPDLRQYYKNMVERMQEGKPENWDGTYRATSK